MNIRESYTAREVRTILRVSQRSLDYWDEKQFVCPSREKTAPKRKNLRGRGPQRLYSFDDLIKLKVLKELRSTGLSLEKIKKGLGKLQRRFPDSKPLEDKVLLTDGKKFQLVRSDGKIEDLLSNGQLVFGVMSLRSIEAQVRRQIRRLPQLEVVTEAKVRRA